MAKTRQEKEVHLAELEQALAGKAIVLTKYTGLTVRDLSDLRAELRAVGGEYRVTKNTLLAKALAGRKMEIPQDILSLQLGIAISHTDEVEPNKIIVKFAKTHEPLQILGALIEGKFIDESSVRKLAALPSRDELYAKVVGSLAAPMSGLVNVMAGNLRGLVRVLDQYREHKATA